MSDARRLTAEELGALLTIHLAGVHPESVAYIRKRIAALEAELAAAREQVEALQVRAERAEEILSHNMALANANARGFQKERDAIIANLRTKYSAMEIADMAGLTRQRVHQILNEQQAALARPAAAQTKEHK